MKIDQDNFPEDLKIQILLFEEYIKSIHPNWKNTMSVIKEDTEYQMWFSKKVGKEFKPIKYFNFIYRDDMNPVWQIQRHRDGIVETFYRNNKINSIFE